MEEKAQNLSKKKSLSSVQCVMFGILSVPLLFWTVFRLRPIQVSAMPLDFLNCFVFMFLYLSSNSAFLLLLCNVIIVALMVLSKPSESHDYYNTYLKEIEGKRKQMVVAEPDGIERKIDIVGECTEISSAENGNQPEMEGGDCCNEEKSMWASSLAVVQYQEFPHAHTNDEELKRRCDEFISQFRRQMSLHSSSNI